MLRKNGNDNLEDQKLVSYLEYLEKLGQLSTEQLDSVWLELQNNHSEIYLLDDIIRVKIFLLLHIRLMLSILDI